MIRSSTQYLQTGTKYYRLASRKLFDYYGENLQNRNKHIRKIYIADEGYKFNQRDQSGAEALIVAYLCRHGNFRDLFLHGIKPHIYVCLHIFKNQFQQHIKHEGLDIKVDLDELCNTAIADLTKNPWWKSVARLIQSSDDWPSSIRYYYIGKQICHSSNYGIGPGRFVLNTLEKSDGKIVLKVDEAKSYLSFYHDLFPEIHEWHGEVQGQVRSTRYLYNLIGDPIYFSGDVNDERAVKEFYSAVPQSTVGQITRMAYVKMQQFIELTKVDWDIMQDNHDSILTQCPDSEDEVTQCHKIMKQYIEPELLNSRGERFNMRSEGASGYNWAPTKFDKDGNVIDNPRGLRAVNI